MKQLALILILLVPGFVSLCASEVTESDSIRYFFSPVVVTGERFETPRKNITSAVTVISASDLQHSNHTTVVEAVSEFAPGVFTTQKSNLGFGLARYSAGGVYIRGIGASPNTQNLILIDGRPDFMGIFGHPLADAYPLDNVERIEVLRGPASAVYGTNAMGGVVNIITRQMKTDGFFTRLSAEYGSFNTQVFLIQHGGKRGALDYFATASHRSSDGNRDNSGILAQTYSMRLGYQLNSHFGLSANASVTPYEFDDPGPIVGVPAFDHGQVTRSTMEMNINNQFAHTDGSFKFHRNSGKHEFTDGWDSKDQTLGMVAFQNFHLPGDLSLTLGLDWKTYGGIGKSNGALVADKTVQETAGYSSVQKILWRHLVLNAGLRYEHHSDYGAETMPRFGFIYNFSFGTSLRGSVAKGFRSPSVRELYFFQSANPSLEPERLWSYEAGIGQQFGDFIRIEVDAFYIDAKQLIGVVRGKTINIGANTIKGLEFHLKTAPFHHFQAQAQYAHLLAEEDLIYSPNKLTFRLNYQWRRLALTAAVENIRSLYGLKYANPFVPTIEPMDNYTVINGILRYPIGQKLALQLVLDNLANAEYQVLFGYPMPGRSFRTGISYQF